MSVNCAPSSFANPAATTTSISSSFSAILDRLVGQV